ncbi:MAG: tetratricopeptide repeat protein [Planctomycetota bacterium]|jgi:Tfp pilus assembly protein PilF
MRPALLALLLLAGAARAQDEAAAAQREAEAIRAQEEARAARERREAELLRRAQRYFDGRNHAAAARVLEQVLATRTGDAAARALLGHCYFEMGRLEQARSEFTRAVGLGRLTSDVVIRLAHIAREQGTPAAALSALRLAHLLVPRDAAVLSAAGDAAAAAGLREEAASALRAAADLDPARPDTFLRLGNLHLKQGATARALTAFETAYHLGAPTAELERIIAELHVEHGDLPCAAGWYERLLLRKPRQEGELRLRCAELLAAAGDVEQARDYAGRLAPNADKALAGGAYLLLGRLARRTKEMPVAVEHWRRALDLGEGGPEIHGALGTHFYRLGEHARAAQHLRQRLRQGPPDPGLARALIRSLVAVGELKAAREELVSLVAEFGLDEPAERLIADLARAAPKGER